MSRKLLLFLFTAIFAVGLTVPTAHAEENNCGEPDHPFPGQPPGWGSAGAENNGEPFEELDPDEFPWSEDPGLNAAQHVNSAQRFVESFTHDPPDANGEGSVEGWACDGDPEEEEPEPGTCEWEGTSNCKRGSDIRAGGSYNMADPAGDTAGNNCVEVSANGPEGGAGAFVTGEAVTSEGQSGFGFSDTDPDEGRGNCKAEEDPE